MGFATKKGKADTLPTHLDKRDGTNCVKIFFYVFMGSFEEQNLF